MVVPGKTCAGPGGLAEGSSTAFPFRIARAEYLERAARFL
jgi:hypothetical protein